MSNSTTTKLLAGVVVLQGVLLGSWWLGDGSSVQAQVPDAGSQRMQIVQELRQLNDRMDRLMSLMESGRLQVQAVSPEEGNGSQRR